MATAPYRPLEKEKEHGHFTSADQEFEARPLFYSFLVLFKEGGDGLRLRKSTIPPLIPIESTPQSCRWYITRFLPLHTLTH